MWVVSVKPYLIVSGDFVKTGGMDRANYALASYLARHGFETHLVAHRVSPSLAEQPQVVVHRVPKPANSYTLAQPLLDWYGRFWARRIAARGGRVVVNGGNCRWYDVNWTQHVNSAWQPKTQAGLLRRLKLRLDQQTALQHERNRIGRARLVITQSVRTREHVVRLFGVAGERVHTVYYGIDSELFRPSNAGERKGARLKLGYADGRPLVGFIGALGDNRKGFDTVFSAWQNLCSQDRWDADLLVLGAGGEVPIWQARARAQSLEHRVRFLGFRHDAAELMPAFDALVAPTRYEGYGLVIHEALCCGVPAFVSSRAPAIERFPSELQDLIVDDPDDAEALAKRLRRWRAEMDETRARVMRFNDFFRSRTWDDMAREMVELIETCR